MGIVERGFPPRLRWQSRSAHKNKPRVVFARQVLGDHQSYAAQPAGDEAYGSRFQAATFWGGGQIQRFERLSKPLSLAKGDRRIVANGGHLGDNLGRRFRCLSALKVYVDTATSDSGNFLGDNSCRAE